LFSLITGTKTNMLLIILLGLIAKLALVSGQCDDGTGGVNNFDWNKVGVGVFTRCLVKAASKNAVCVYTSFVIPLRNSR
jgi:hypothetical protein